MAETALYLVLFDVEPSYIPEFRDWYTQRHAPDLLSSGFMSAHAYEATVGGPRFANVYETRAKEVFRGKAYAEARARDTELSRAESMLRNLEKATYAQRLLGPGTAGPAEPPLFDAEWAMLVRFDLPESLDGALRSWLEAEEAARLQAAGASRPRLGFRTGGHPLFPESVCPRVLIATEWASDPVDDTGLVSRLAERFGTDLSRVGCTVGRRYYRGVRAPEA